MDDHEMAGRTAIITGAASGIGLALAHRAVSAGMNVVLSDIEGGELRKAADEVRAGGSCTSEVHAVTTDVGQLDDVRALAAQARNRFGPPWLVINNAGIAFSGSSWKLRHGDWEWSLRVNLWGVIHGIETFLPDMVADDYGYLVNTASMAGLVTGPGNAHYSASKHAVIGVTESLYRELEAAGSQVGVSVLCPGLVNTNISTAHRNAPDSLGGAPAAAAGGRIPDDFPGRLSPASVASLTFDAIIARRFWILTHPNDYAAAIQARAHEMGTGTNPSHSSVDPVLGAVVGVDTSQPTEQSNRPPSAALGTK